MQLDEEEKHLQAQLKTVNHDGNANGKKDRDGVSDVELSRADVLVKCNITSQGLNYRIKYKGHPPPCRVEGRKQWFSLAEIEVWRKSQN